MATEKRLIDANALLRIFNPLAWDNAYIESAKVTGEINVCPTVDAVEVSRLGKLGKMMMPYLGCPRGMIGPRGEAGGGKGRNFEILELDPITDIDGNRWVPVLDSDLAALKDRKQGAVEVVHGRWDNLEGDPMWQKCSACGYILQYSYSKDCNYCPNCGAKMDKNEKP